ncbi:multimerin-2 isoform X1 [Notechis scutatus]|uniref:Multimerin-2 isoform X1 n=1 Tax=Notechis scutatus TaxID=8663 RepID=A0A6J1UGH4_9SAUR|nr:multimerin-2 isoform X1 [Notechis scutatus]
MLTTLLLLCGAVGLVKSDSHSRHPGYHPQRPGPEVPQMPAPPALSSPAEEFWRGESIQGETEADVEEFYPASHESRNENWCSSVQYRHATYIAVCRTEKYIIRSQQPCPNGTPDCQKIMYRTAVKPVYKIKEKVVSFLDWKCCPGYVGKDCEQYDPAQFPVGTSQPEHWEEAFSNRNSGDVVEAHQSHEAVLEDLQNDIHQTANSLGILRKVLHHNSTDRNGGTDQHQSELQQMLFLHINSFLKEHFNPVWASFNKSLQDLSVAVQNLSQSVEANRKSIERFQESSVPRKDFQELGTKFESKVQANVLRADQMKREMDHHNYLQQAVIHYNLTMIKADTDLKLKRHHKLQQSFLFTLNNSLADMRQEQNKLRGELEILNRNVAMFPRQSGNQNGVFADTDIQSFNQTLEKHARELKMLYEESEKDYEELTDSITRLKDSSKRDIEDFRVRLIEGSLMIDEYREDVEKRIFALNDSLADIQENYWSLQKSMKTCCCEDPPSGIHVEDLKNTTQMHGEHLKHLEARLKDLTAAFPLIHQSLDFQQEQSWKLQDGLSLLKNHSDISSEEVNMLKKADEKMRDHVRYLNSSFNSLLVDALRHEKALEVLLGEEILEHLYEEEVILPTDQFPVMNIKLISDHLKKQSMALENFKKRIDFLEADHEDNPHDHKSLKGPDPEKQTDLNPQHGRVEYMEPNHEAFMEDALDNPAYHDITTLKREIGHLTKEMKKFELQWDYIHSCCNQTKANLGDFLGVSVKEVKEDLVSAQKNFEEHLAIFHKLFGNSKDLAASNVSLDVAKLQLLMSKKPRKQLKEKEQQNMREKKEVHGHREATLNGRNKINAETLETDTAVAFYVQYAEDKEEPSVFNRTYINYGGGYSHEHGYFKASHNGVYMVVVGAEFPPGPALGQLVFSNGHRMTLVNNKKRKSSGGYTTVFALVELEKGDFMWFELVQGAAVRQNTVGLSMAGFLLLKT